MDFDDESERKWFEEAIKKDNWLKHWGRHLVMGAIGEDRDDHCMVCQYKKWKKKSRRDLCP